MMYGRRLKPAPGLSAAPSLALALSTRLHRARYLERAKKGREALFGAGTNGRPYEAARPTFRPARAGRAWALWPRPSVVVASSKCGRSSPAAPARARRVPGIQKGGPFPTYGGAPSRPPSSRRWRQSCPLLVARPMGRARSGPGARSHWGSIARTYGRGPVPDGRRLRAMQPQGRGRGRPGFRACTGPPWPGASAGGRWGVGPTERRPGDAQGA